MPRITAICREEGFEKDIMIYPVDVNDPRDPDEVQAAVQAERVQDAEDCNTVEVLFVFAGDLTTLSDWRR